MEPTVADPGRTARHVAVAAPSLARLVVQDSIRAAELVNACHGCSGEAAASMISVAPTRKQTACEGCP
jgi:hypothetical protein